MLRASRRLLSVVMFLYWNDVFSRNQGINVCRGSACSHDATIKKITSVRLFWSMVTLRRSNGSEYSWIPVCSPDADVAGSTLSPHTECATACSAMTATTPKTHMAHADGVVGLSGFPESIETFFESIETFFFRSARRLGTVAPPVDEAPVGSDDGGAGGEFVSSHSAASRSFECTTKGLRTIGVAKVYNSRGECVVLHTIINDHRVDVVLA